MCDVTKENADQIIDEAFTKAESVSRSYLYTHGELPFNCGFAWVEIRPARGALVSALKKRGIGSKGWNGGWHIWNPSGINVQDMTVKFEGAIEFAYVLQSYGIDAKADCRLD